MDITTLLLPILAQLKPIIAGLVLSVLVQVAKQADSVTALPADNAKRIKGVAGFLSFLAAVLVAFSDGNLASLDWSAVANVLTDFLFVLVSSAGTWAIALKGRTLVK